MLYLILAESAIETIPQKIARHPAVATDAKKRGKNPSQMLLDSTKHFAAMHGLDEEKKRGRPDIIHFCISLALDSVLNKKGLLQVLVHTRNDQVITVNPELRIPRAYNRFAGLMEDLFEKREIKAEEKTLLKLENKSLKQLLGEIECKRVFALDVGGEFKSRKALQELFESEKDAVLVVGGFPHGNFADASKALEGVPRISIAQEELCAWTVVSVLISSCEAATLG